MTMLVRTCICVILIGYEREEVTKGEKDRERERGRRGERGRGERGGEREPLLSSSLH